MCKRHTHTYTRAHGHTNTQAHTHTYLYTATANRHHHRATLANKTPCETSDQRHCAGGRERMVAHWCILQIQDGRTNKKSEKGTSVSATQVGRLPLHHRACMRRWPDICLCSCIASNLHSGVCEINSRGVKWWPDPPFTPTCNIGRPAYTKQTEPRQHRLFFRRTKTLPRSHHRHNIKFGGTGAAWWTSRCSGGFFFQRHRTP